MDPYDVGANANYLWNLWNVEAEGLPLPPQAPPAQDEGAIAAGFHKLDVERMFGDKKAALILAGVVALGLWAAYRA